MTASDDEQSSFFRHGRFFWVEDDDEYSAGWYTETREGVRGPFPSRHLAEVDLLDLITRRPRRRVRTWSGERRVQK